VLHLVILAPVIWVFLGVIPKALTSGIEVGSGSTHQ